MIKEEYVQVRPADNKLIRNIFHQARHFRTLDDFSFECGYTPRTFYHVVHDEDRVKCIPDEMLKSVAAHADKDSRITEEKIMAAGGKIKDRAFYAGKKPPEAVNYHRP